MIGPEEWLPPSGNGRYRNRLTVRRTHLPRGLIQGLRNAGGEGDDRYPWDGPIGATTDKATILTCANTNESGINNTSPVAMYPQGSSRPFGLQDMAGNVWEWTASWYDQEQRGRVLRGGSWYFNQRFARVSIRYNYAPVSANHLVGFRPVAPVDSGS